MTYTLAIPEGDKQESLVRNTLDSIGFNYRIARVGLGEDITLMLGLISFVGVRDICCLASRYEHRAVTSI